MKKLLLSSLFCIAFSNAYAFSGPGAGTAGNPYLIETCAHLQEIANDGSAIYALTQDIDCDGVSFTSISSLTGTLNGYGWTIENLTINEAGNAGLFINMNGTTKNLVLDNADITGNNYTGAITAILGGTIQDVTIINSAIEGNNFTVGGITGSMGNGTLIERVQVTNTTITGNTSRTGGVVGAMSGTAIIREAYTQATIIGDEDTGGIAARMLQDALIENSESRSTVTTNGVGVNGSVGGVVSEMWHDSILRNSVHGSGTITANNGVEGGGLVGDIVHGSTTLTASYYDDSITCTNCTNTTGQTDITNLTEAVLDPQGWDFDDVWFDDPGLTNELPQLRSETHKLLTPREAITYPQFTDTPYFRFNVLAAGTLSYGGSCTGGLTSPSAGNHETVFASLTPGTYTDCTIQLTTSTGSYPSNVLEVPPFTVVDTSFTGSGTDSNPYQVSNCYKLQSMQDDLTAHYQLTSNIDCSETSKWNFGAGYDPVSDNDNRFTGSLDGQGFTISDLSFTRTGELKPRGLFGALDQGAVVEDLTLSNIDYNGHTSVGGIAGINWNATIQDISVTGSITGVDGILAGIAGDNYGGTIQRVQTNVNISGNGGIGGVVGYQGLGGSLKEAYSIGVLTGTEENTTIGGVLAIAFSPSTTEDVASLATINGQKYLGGIVSSVVSDAVVRKGYFAGSINSTNPQYVGGIYGSKYDESVLKSLYYDQEITCTGCDNTYGVVPSDNLKDALFLEDSGWRFGGSNAIWVMKSGAKYPDLTFIAGLDLSTSTAVSTATKSNSGSGKSKTIRWAGMNRDEVMDTSVKVDKHNFDQYYAESKAQVAKMNTGFSGSQTYMVNRWGEHVFAGYLPGRLGLDRFKHRFQNIVRFGSGSLSLGRGIVAKDTETAMLASAPVEGTENTDTGWANEYQLAKDKYTKPVVKKEYLASAPVYEGRTIAQDQVVTHKNQRTYYRKKGVVDRKRDISMVRPSRMDATKDNDTIKIRFGNKKVALSKYLQNNLFGNTDGENDTSTSALLFLFLGSFGVIGIAMVWSLKRQKNTS